MIDRDQLVDRATAALLVGIEPRTIDTWVRRGHLKRTMTGPHGKALYRVGAVLDANAATLKKNRRQTTRNPRQLAR